MDKISVIVPIYNVKEYLNRCLDSILCQTYKNIELILIDDGSTDGSEKICDDYAKKDNRVVVYHQKNSGVSASRNKGLELATGEYIGFVDSDDYINEEMYEKLLNCLKLNNASISMCKYQLLNYGSVPKEINNTGEIVYPQIDAMKRVIISYEITSHLWNKLYKKELWDGITFPIGKKFEDLAVMYLVIEKINKLSILNENLYYYTRRQGSIMKTINTELLDNMREAFIIRNKYLENKYDYYRKEIEISKVKYNKMSIDYLFLGKLKDYQNKEIVMLEYKICKKIFWKNIKYMKKILTIKQLIQFTVLYTCINIYKLAIFIIKG